MILLDTNVVIDMINDQNHPAWELFQKEDIVLCGVVISELCRGFRNKNEQQAIELFIESVDSLPTEETDWKQIGLLLSKLQKAGISVPFQDAVIAYLAIKNASQLLTRDNHFKLIQTSEPSLKLLS